MRRLSRSIRGPWLMALLVVSLVWPEGIAEAGKGGKGGGRGGRAPRMAAPRRPSVAPRSNAVRSAHVNNTPHVNNNGMATANHRVTASNGNVASTRTNANATSGNVRNGVRATGSTGASVGSSVSRPNAYAYGSGSNVRHYTANGYGHGYRNRSSGSHYGRSQSNNRSLVARLRSVHSSLARLDHDYRGHRVNAMRSISMAIRMLSHRASSLRTNGNGNLAANRLVANNGNAAGVRNGNRANGLGQGQRMSQAQSDGRMRQALRTTQGIHMQMANNSSSRSSSSNGHLAARTHTGRAIHEMQVALTAR